MNTSVLKNCIATGGFDKEFALLYNEKENARKRYINAICEFEKLYGPRENVRLFSAPGRTEIGGNHTDHQHGLVLTASINLDIIAVVAANDDGIIRIKSKEYNKNQIDISDLNIKQNEKSYSNSLVRGVVSAFNNNGYKIGGFDAYTTSNVPRGSGLSSSAAFEVLVANIINALYNENKVDSISIAKFSQFAEREYFGKPCGLLDQMACSVGGILFADFCEVQNPVVEKIELDLSKYGYTLCVVNTGGSHADLTADYADITLECKAVSEFLGVKFLRDANEQEFYKNITALREKCGDRALLRAIHIFEENKRVIAQKNALKQGDFNTFLVEVKYSGESSYDLLQNVYSPTNPQEQAISLALALTKQYLKGQGVCRVHGGGFAGTIQCYIQNKIFDNYRQTIESVFGENSCVPLFVRTVGGYELKCSS